jgi:hypothetical protein
MSRFTRRGLLAGLGAAALLPATRARAARAPARLLLVVQTGGYFAPSWRPPAGPLSGPLPNSFEPLNKYLANLCVLPRLARPSGDGCYGWLFHGKPIANGGPFAGPAGATLDQLVAARLAGPPPLALAVGLARGTAQPGFNRAFWRDRESPIEPAIDPFASYQRLFASQPGKGAVADQLADDENIASYLLRSYQQLGRNNLAPGARERLQFHLEALGQLHRRIGALAADPVRACSPGPLGRGDAPLDPEARANYPALVEASFDLATAALACGAARVVTIQLSDASAAGIDAGLVTGATRGRSFHDVNTATNTTGLAEKRRLDRWHMERFAGLLDRLVNPALAGGSFLLDDTVVVWANAEADGRTPALAEVPLLIAGSGFGPHAVVPYGRCLDDAGLTLSGVLARVAEGFGAAAHPFGPPAAI